MQLFSLMHELKLIDSCDHRCGIQRSRAENKLMRNNQVGSMLDSTFMNVHVPMILFYSCNGSSISNTVIMIVAILATIIQVVIYPMRYNRFN